MEINPIIVIGVPLDGDRDPKAIETNRMRVGAVLLHSGMEG